MRHFIIYILLIFVIVSCKKNGSDFEKTLVNNRWIYYPAKEVKDSVRFIYYLKFYENRKCKNFYISSDIEYNLLESEDDKNDWDYDENTNVLIVFGNHFKILSVNNDTIHMQKDGDSNKNVILFKYLSASPHEQNEKDVERKKENNKDAR